MPVRTGDEVRVEGWDCWTEFGFAVTTEAKSAEFTVTMALFEVTVTGMIELSVTLS